MAKFVLTDAYVSLAANDLSDHVKSVTINYSADMQDDTAMGATSHARIGGLKDWSLDIEFHQDFAASNLDSILFPTGWHQHCLHHTPCEKHSGRYGQP